MSNFNVPYLVGDKYQRDHGYWPTVLRSEYLELVLGGTDPVLVRLMNGLYPIGLTLEQMMGLFWRVRTWKIAGASFAINTTVTDDPVTPDDFAVRHDTGTTVDFSFDTKRRQTPADSVPQIDLTSERDTLADWRNHPLKKDYYPPSLVTPTPVPLWKTLRNVGIQDAANYNRDDPENPFLIRITDSFTYSVPLVLEGDPILVVNPMKFSAGSVMVDPPRFFMSNDYVLYDPNAKLFYPKMFLGFGGFLVFNLMKDEAPATPGTIDVLCGQLSVSFGSTGIPSFQVPIIRTANEINTYSGHYPGEDRNWKVGLETTGSFNLTMTPTKFWPYMNGLGEFCYDANDGHQIHDPFA